MPASACPKLQKSRSLLRQTVLLSYSVCLKSISNPANTVAHMLHEINVLAVEIHLLPMRGRRRTLLVAGNSAAGLVENDSPLFGCGAAL